MEHAYLFDTETTGQDDQEVIEAAWFKLQDPISWMQISSFNQRYRPQSPITFGAMAVHHITDNDLIDCPPSASFSLPDDANYIIGHNIDFDWDVAGKPDVRRICTLALARTYLPDSDSHNQSALMYYLLGAKARDKVKDAHSALVDVTNCQILLEALVSTINELNPDHPIRSWEDLWNCSEQARVPVDMPFGKHKGEPIVTLPTDYKNWLLRQNNIDPYLRQALMQSK